MTVSRWGLPRSLFFSHSGGLGAAWQLLSNEQAAKGQFDLSADKELPGKPEAAQLLSGPSRVDRGEEQEGRLQAVRLQTAV